MAVHVLKLIALLWSVKVWIIVKLRGSIIEDTQTHKDKKSVTLPLYFTKNHAMMENGSVDVNFHAFLASTLDRGGQVHD